MREKPGGADSSGDVLFSRIVPVHHGGEGAVDFRYEFHLPLRSIRGTGPSSGHRHQSDRPTTSVLRFDTADPLSPIGQGSGYWRYIPTSDGIRFIIGYNHRRGMRLVGKALDSSVIRPALGRARGPGFDRLRFWVESDVDPQPASTRTASSPGVALAGVAAALSSIAIPSHWTIPRARRCLHRAPDARAARAPCRPGRAEDE